MTLEEEAKKRNDALDAKMNEHMKSAHLRSERDEVIYILAFKTGVIEGINQVIH